ncbi:hypothetical protein HZH66_014697 [Vespula vulgaris]|uniref:Uncharacterized protein n=1 Tax=Vespula vulgaris TaxID=7454 RepID=A0A834IYL9_VESVU|nr:hypothetical protein HZH66_014697 [Vespula vulgaris]
MNLKHKVLLGKGIQAVDPKFRSHPCRFLGTPENGTIYKHPPRHDNGLYHLYHLKQHTLDKIRNDKENLGAINSDSEKEVLRINIEEEEEAEDEEEGDTGDEVVEGECKY